MKHEYLDPYDVTSWKVCMLFAGGLLILILRVSYCVYRLLMQHFKVFLGIQSAVTQRRLHQSRENIQQCIYNIVADPFVQHNIAHPASS
jgi:hypothetical protein